MCSRKKRGLLVVVMEGLVYQWLMGERMGISRVSAKCQQLFGWIQQEHCFWKICLPVPIDYAQVLSKSCTRVHWYRNQFPIWSASLFLTNSSNDLCKYSNWTVLIFRFLNRMSLHILSLWLNKLKLHLTHFRIGLKRTVIFHVTIKVTYIDNGLTAVLLIFTFNLHITQ